jgi:hypothetical protein
LWRARNCSRGVGKGLEGQASRSSCIQRIRVSSIGGPESVSDDGLIVPGGAIASVPCRDSPVSHADGSSGRRFRWQVCSPKSGAVQGVARRYTMTGGFRNVGSPRGGPLGQGPLRRARNDVAPIVAPAAAAASLRGSPAPRIGQGKWALLRGLTRRGCRPTWAARLSGGEARRRPPQAWSGPAACP